MIVFFYSKVYYQNQSKKNCKCWMTNLSYELWLTKIIKDFRLLIVSILSIVVKLSKCPLKHQLMIESCFLPWNQHCEMSILWIIQCFTSCISIPLRFNDVKNWFFMIFNQNIVSHSPWKISSKFAIQSKKLVLIFYSFMNWMIFVDCLSSFPSFKTSTKKMKCWIFFFWRFQSSNSESNWNIIDLPAIHFQKLYMLSMETGNLILINWILQYLWYRYSLNHKIRQDLHLTMIFIFIFIFIIIFIFIFIFIIIFIFIFILIIILINQAKTWCIFLITNFSQISVLQLNSSSSISENSMHFFWVQTSVKFVIIRQIAEETLIDFTVNSLIQNAVIQDWLIATTIDLRTGSWSAFWNQCRFF